MNGETYGIGRVEREREGEEAEEAEKAGRGDDTE